MIAIETRYVGPTNRKPGRIIATAGDSGRLIISYPHEAQNAAAAHRIAAEQFAREMDWLSDGSKLLAGQTRRGYVFVFVNPQEGKGD